MMNFHNGRYATWLGVLVVEDRYNGESWLHSLLAWSEATAERVT
jgi:hypothetical protein